MYPGSKPVKILLIEDESSDTVLIKEAFKDLSFYAKIFSVENGEQAIQYLLQAGEYSEVESPDLILLDLNLPKRNGFALLNDLKTSPKFRKIPVIIIATDSSPEVVRKCYDLQANSFIAKPAKLDDFYDMVKELENFWLRTVRLAH